MTSKRLFQVLVAGSAFLVIASVAVTYEGALLLKQKGQALLDLKLQNAVLQEKQVALVRAKSDIAKYAELESIAKTIVPQEKDQARTVRELVAIANASGIPLASIEFPDSALGQVKKTGTAKTSSDPTKSQLTAVEGMKGVYAMDITLQSSPDNPVTYEQLLSMLKRIEQNRRTAHVTNLSITPSETDRSRITFTVTVTVYIKP